MADPGPVSGPGDTPPPPDGVTRLGPDSGGRVPNESSVTYREWSWSSESAARGGLPFLGVFLVLFGILLFLQQAVPGTSFWSWLALAAGAACLIVFASRRRLPGTGFLLWLGVVLVAIGLPSVLISAGLLPERDGWSTLFLGVALMALGLIRRTRPGSRPRSGSAGSSPSSVSPRRPCCRTSATTCCRSSSSGSGPCSSCAPSPSARPAEPGYPSTMANARTGNVDSPRTLGGTA